MRYSVTGTRSTTAASRGIIRDVLRELEMPREFSTGAAYGVDTIAYEEAVKLWPRIKHRVCVPQGQVHNMELVEAAVKAGHSIEFVRGGYLKRNDVLVQHCDMMLAFPKTDVEEIRSGTWSTIRRCRRANVPYRLTPAWKEQDGS